MAQTNLNVAAEKIQKIADASKEKIEEVGEELSAKAQVLSKRGQKLSKNISTQFKNNPWTYIAAVSVGSWVIGHLMGRKAASKRK